MNNVLIITAIALLLTQNAFADSNDAYITQTGSSGCSDHPSWQRQYGR
jgi:hypothetical protein